MEYMESQMNQRFDSFNDKVDALEPFIEDLIAACKKHSIDQSDLSFTVELLAKGCMGWAVDVKDDPSELFDDTNNALNALSIKG